MTRGVPEAAGAEPPARISSVQSCRRACEEFDHFDGLPAESIERRTGILEKIHHIDRFVLEPPIVVVARNYFPVLQAAGDADWAGRQNMVPVEALDIKTDFV